MPKNDKRLNGREPRDPEDFASQEEKFRTFFSTSVAQVPDEMKRRDEEKQQEEAEKQSNGLLGWLLNREKKEREEAANPPAKEEPPKPVELPPTGEIRLGGEEDAAEPGAIKKHVCACRDLPLEEAKKRVEAGEPFVIRQRIPHEGTTTFHDASFGDITVENKELEDQVLLKSDGLPTYNFANVVDDHLMGITHVVRGSEYLSSAPKYNLLYEAFGWEIPTYVHCSPVMRDAQHKMSKRHGDPSYEDLIREGYLTEAVLNYVALLGWSPKGENAEREFYTLAELAEIFDISGISKSPAVFDINKLRWMNAEYMKKLSPEAFFAKAEPVLKAAVTKPAVDLRAVAALVQPRCEILSDLPERVDFIDKLPEYSTELYVHKKSKTTLENSLSSLQAIVPVLEGLQTWTNESLYEALVALAAKLEVKNSVVLWPLRVAVSGKASTPGGATELCALLGKEESLARIRTGIELLRK